METNLATKLDIRDVREEIKDVRQEIQLVRQDMIQLEQRITIKLGSIVRRPLQAC